MISSIKFGQIGVFLAIYVYCIQYCGMNIGAIVHRLFLQKSVNVKKESLPTVDKKTLTGPLRQYKESQIKTEMSLSVCSMAAA